MKIPGKKAAVWGLGITGVESARFLSQRGFDVFAFDQMTSPELSERSETLKREGISVETGTAEPSRLWECEWILISPGIRPTLPLYVEARRRGMSVWSEIEAASWFCPSPHIYAVTGSAGKTTVTTLLAQVLAKSGRRTVTCGNIGNPWIREVDAIRPSDVVVMELSSFQLFHCETFCPEIGVLLNISPNHLDWHKDMPEYVHAKLNLFRNQRESDLAILRSEDEEKYFPGEIFGARKIYSDRREIRSNPAGGELNPNEYVISLAADSLGIEDGILKEVFRDFRGIEHRLETVETVGGVTFVNDSKCTTPLSLAWGLAKYPPGTVVLIAGGRAKSSDFGTLKKVLGERVKKAVLIGESRDAIASAWEGACPALKAVDFRAAVHAAFQAAAPGDTVLLSPGCASFDMFKNYGDRGRIFKEIVRDLKREAAAVGAP
ncbi:MAG: UDP-N-acetylmuramoyl-L-alanine--D-glutamate ligase [Candidatus Omnitrophota bacterium]|jgi:UDP-N-acetylmuramoylalanine--D-glutamate ligase